MTLSQQLDDRIERPELYFEIAESLRKRSTCLRGKVGCIAVRDKRIIAMGYNGSPPGMPHCFELGCDMEENNHVAGCQRTIHAEANLIAFSAKHGIELQGAALWCTHGPCLKCAQLIVAAGLVEDNFITPYRLPQGETLCHEAGVKVLRWSAGKVIR